MEQEQKNLFGWFEENEQLFTVEQVKELVCRIKVFNAGAIDQYLTNHVDHCLDKWLCELKGGAHEQH